MTSDVKRLQDLANKARTVGEHEAAAIYELAAQKARQVEVSLGSDGDVKGQ